MKKILTVILSLICWLNISAQINTDRVMIIGRNALYYEDYILAIQYFNQVVQAKPYLGEPYFFRAIAKYYLEDFKGAEDDCTLAVERNSYMTRAYQLRADAKQAQEKYEEALEDYSRALESNPYDKFSLINLGIVNIQLKKYDKAEVTLDKLSEIYPKYAQNFLVKGAMYTEKGDTIKAFENYEHAIELDKYNSQAYSMLGLLYYYTHQYDSALVNINEAIHIDPLYAGNYINRGLIKYSKNDLRGAMADYDKVISTEPNNIIARFNRGLLRAQVGDNNNAIEDFNAVLQHEPRNYIAIYNRAFLKSTTADYNGAISDINIIIEKYPTFYNGYYFRSQIKRDMNDLKGADRDYNTARNLEAQALKNPVDKSDFEKTREQSDDDLEKFNLLVVADKETEAKSKYQSEKRGRVQDRNVSLDIEPIFILTYYEKTDDSKSRVYFSKLVENLNDKNTMIKAIRLTNNEISLNALQIDEHFNSINNLSGAIASDTLNADLYFARAIDFMLVQDFHSAIEDFNKAIKINPNFTLAYFSQAVVLGKQLELKDYSIAYEAAEGKMAISPSATNSTIGINSQTSSISTSQDNRSIENEMILRNYNKVIELNPEFAYAYYNRGNIKYSKNDYRGAVLDYNAAIKQNPTLYEAYYNRGLARFQLKDKERALEDMRKAGEGGIIEAYGIIKRMAE